MSEQKRWINVVKMDRQKKREKRERRLTKDKNRRKEAFLSEFKRLVNKLKQERQNEREKKKKKRETEDESGQVEAFLYDLNSSKCGIV